MFTILIGLHEENLCRHIVVEFNSTKEYTLKINVILHEHLLQAHIIVGSEW